MEQYESLKGELQHLIALQQQQLGLLGEMNSHQRKESSWASVNTMGPSTNVQFQSHNQNVSYQPEPMVNDAALKQQQQFSTYASSLSGKDNQYGFTDMVFSSGGTKMSDQSRAMMSMDTGSRIGQAAVAGVGALGATAASYGISSLAPGLLGLGGSIFGGAAIGLYTDMSVKEIKKQNAYEKYLYKNSGKFINASESNNTRALGGFSVGESKDAASFLRNYSNKVYLKDEEMMSLTQKFTDGGLLKDSKDLETFKDKIKSLTKNVKTGALMLNESYDNIAELMSELKKAGIDQKDFDKMMGMGAVLGGNLNLDGTNLTREMINTVQQLNYGTGISNSSTLTRFQDTTVYTGAMYDELEAKKDKTQTEKMLWNTIKNYGGPDKAAQQVQIKFEQMVDANKDIRNPALAFFDWDNDKKEFRFDRASMASFMKGDQGLSDLLKISQEKLQSYQSKGQGDAILNWENSAGIYIKNNLEDGDMSKYMQRVLDSYKKDTKYAGLGEREILGMLGVNNPNDQTFMSAFLKYRELKGDSLGEQAIAQADWAAATAKRRTEQPSLGEWIQSGWDKAKKAVTSPMVNMASGVQEFMLKATDKWYGFDENRNTRYDKYFQTHSSGLKSLSGKDVDSGLERLTKQMSEATKSLETLAQKGYTVDKKLLDNTSDKSTRSPEEIKKQMKLDKGFDKTSSDVWSQSQFIKENKAINMTRSEIDKVQRDIMMNSQNASAINYVNKLSKKMESGMFSNVEDALADDRLLREQRKKLEKGTFGQKGMRDSEIKKLESLEAQKINGERRDKTASTLRSFGTVLGVKQTDYKNTSEYSVALVEGANRYYKDNRKAYEDFAKGKNTKAAQSWNEMTAQERLMTFETMSELEKDVIDTGKKGSVKKVGKKKGETEEQRKQRLLFDDDEREKLQYLHKDKNGKVYYDSSQKSKSKITTKDFANWIDGGEKARNPYLTRGIAQLDIKDEKDEKNIFGKVTKKGKKKDEILAGMSTTEVSNRAKEQYAKVTDENIKATKELGDKIKSLKDNGSRNLNDNETSKVLKMVEDNNRQGLVALKNSLEKSGGVEGKVKAVEVKKIMDLMDKIDSTDPKGLLSMMDAMKELENIGKDLGHSMMYTKQKLDTPSYDTQLTEAIKKLSDDLFTNNKDIMSFIEKNAKTPEDIAQMLIDATLNGGKLEGKDGKTVQLSAESLEALISGMADAQTKALKEAFGGSGGRDNLEKVRGDKQLSKRLEEMKVGEGTALTLVDEAIAIQEKIKKSSGSDLPKLQDELKGIIDELVPKYQEATKKLQDDMTNNAKDIGGVGDTIKSTGEDLSKAIVDYDKNIRSAITSLSKEVKESRNSLPSLVAGLINNVTGLNIFP